MENIKHVVDLFGIIVVNKYIIQDLDLNFQLQKIL
ncbi:hypothetical protein CLROS_007730 [Clostridium felsineum]|uniref:Uncharacterized protein n=1 Tax=Clostridium felsineum TaxID=36839 RepID=A0A1S8KWU2_9CLOT|nr:hypothetical protein CLROS_007730 [Clostridium felsineum]URZ10488.1 hypothetical protein CROST_011980 [Clostridium felsineum]